MFRRFPSGWSSPLNWFPLWSGNGGSKRGNKRYKPRSPLLARLLRNLQPGCAWQNECCESFDARLRDALLNGEGFYALHVNSCCSSAARSGGGRVSPGVASRNGYCSRRHRTASVLSSNVPLRGILKTASSKAAQPLRGGFCAWPIIRTAGNGTATFPLIYKGKRLFHWWRLCSTWQFGRSGTYSKAM